MAKLSANISRATYSIQKFLGLNQNETGQTHLKAGEASKLVNFRVTDEGELTPRPVIVKKDNIGISQREMELHVSTNNPLVLYGGCEYCEGNFVVTGEPICTVTDLYETPINEYVGKSYFQLPSGNINRVYLLMGTKPVNGTIVGNGLLYVGKVLNLWSGYFNAREQLIAVTETGLYTVSQWGTAYLFSRLASFGFGDELDHVEVFGFNDKIYLLGDGRYLAYDGRMLGEVSGYIPCVLTACEPNGSGTTYERVNNLSLYRKARYSATGTAKTFTVLEENAKIVTVSIGGERTTEWTQSNGTVTFNTAPPSGTDNVEITYVIENPEKSMTVEYESDATETTIVVSDGTDTLLILGVYYYAPSGTLTKLSDSSYYYNAETHVLNIGILPESGSSVKVSYRKRTPRDDLLEMKYAAMFNGAQDNRIFLYGNGSNKTFYSGITETGKASAEYFPDLNEAEIGATNAPITALVKHYNRLLAFKDNEAYSIYGNVISLADGSATTGFYITSINKDIGCAPAAQAVLVENRVRTLDGNDLYEWRPTSSTGNITYDQRNAERISQRIQLTLKGFDFSKSVLHYDKYRHEFYCICGDRALVQNVDANAWYEYSGFDVNAICSHEGVNYCILNDGAVALIDYEGEPDVESVFESGDIDYGKPNVLKYSPEVWININPENCKALSVTVSSDLGIEHAAELATPTAGAVKPTMRARLKLRKLTTSRLKLETSSRMTITGAQISVAYTNNVK